MPVTKERLTISVNSTIKDSLEKNIPKNQRSAFAEKALGEALDKLAREQALKILENLTPVPNPQNIQSEDILRDIRQMQGHHLRQNYSEDQ